MSEKLKLNPNIAPETEVSISSIGSNTTVTIPVGLHPKDIDRLHEVVGEFLPTCTKTIDFVNGLNEEIRGLNKRRGYE